MKHLLLLSIFICCLQATLAQSKTPVHHKHHKKHVTAHRSNTHMRTQHNIKVSDGDNDYHKAYEGKTSKSNDGVKKNEQRNLNYGNTNANLAPSNGGNMK